MITDAQIKFQGQQEDWLKQFSVQDLSCCLIREFCIKNKLQKTLKTFELEDSPNSHKKINKSIVIKILSLNNLVYYNKQSDKKYLSLLEILVNYLKNKFKEKITKKNNDRMSHKNDLSITPSINGTDDNTAKNNRQEEEYDNDWEEDNIQTNNNKLGYSIDQKLTSHKNKVLLNQTAQLKHTNQYKPNQDYSEKKLVNVSAENAKINQAKTERQNYAKKGEQNKGLKNPKPQQSKKDQSLKLAQKQKEQKEIQSTKKEEQRQKNQKQQKQRRIQEQAKKNKAEKQIQQKKLKAQKEKQAQPIIPQIEKKVQTQAPKPSRMLGMKRKLKNQYSEQLIVDDKKSEQKAIQKQKDQNEIKQNQQVDAMKNQKEKQNSKVHKQQKIEHEAKDSGPKMVKMFGKKKKDLLADQNTEKQQGGPKKFKFDDNFVDEPLNAQIQKYNYEKINLLKINLLENKKLQLDYKTKPIISGIKKPAEKQKNITEQLATALRQVIFQGQGNQCVLPKAWSQGFILSPHKQTPYGLKQIEGGPCGIIAAVQCYYLKHYLCMANLSSENQMQHQTVRENCLVAAITDMLYKSRNQNKIILGLPPKGFAGNKIDYSGLKIYTLDASTFEKAYQAMYSFRSYFIGKNNHGVTVLMICNILTKGIDKIRSQIDMSQSPLIGNHGHCTQELVNLFTTGTASSNCFDGEKIIDSDVKLKGIKQKSQFGFLTIFQALKYIQVGRNLKNPTYPFWIICKQFHYHVIFANHYLISENNDAQKFDIVYFDGLYNCADRIIITLEKYAFGEEPATKVKDLPLIEQVMMTKWGLRKADWNGSIPIL